MQDNTNIEKEAARGLIKEYFSEWPMLIDYLEDHGFYECPAAKLHHGAEKGGLFRHSLQVAMELEKLTAKLGLKWTRSASPRIVGLLHDVCKLDDYLYKEDGEHFYIASNKERTYPGHGEKSLITLMGLIELTPEEKMCIRYHMGAFTSEDEWSYYTRAVKRFPNVLYTHMADMIASQVKEI